MFSHDKRETKRRSVCSTFQVSPTSAIGVDLRHSEIGSICVFHCFTSPTTFDC